MMSVVSAMEGNKIHYYEVSPNEDISQCEQIYLDIYSSISLLNQEGLKNRFALLKSLIGQDITFLCLSFEGTLIGFLTIERLGAGRLALYDSPIVSAYRRDINVQLAAILKERFPEAKEVVVVANKLSPKLIEFVESFGFQRCDDYTPNKHIIPNPEAFQAFKQSLE